MQLSDDDLNEIASHLPEHDLSLPTMAEAQGLLDSSVLLRTRSSAIKLQLQLEARRLVPPNRTWLVTFGFIARGPHIVSETEGFAANSKNYTFGVSAFVDWPAKGGTEPSATSQQLLGPLDVDGFSFPIILTHSRFTPHTLPPIDATSATISEKGSCACWVKYSGSAASPPWDKGLFTARHVVEHLSFGNNVTVDPIGASFIGTVADYGACTVDAAVVEVPAAHWPSGINQVTTLGPYSKALAAGLSVEFEGRITTTRKSGKIVSHHPLPGYWGGMMGQRMVIDVTGKLGDSGGQVDDVKKSQTIGIYMGEINDGSGGKHGLVQDLYQACVYLESDVYA